MAKQNKNTALKLLGAAMAAVVVVVAAVVMSFPPPSHSEKVKTAAAYVHTPGTRLVLDSEPKCAAFSGGNYVWHAPTATEPLGTCECTGNYMWPDPVTVLVNIKGSATGRPWIRITQTLGQPWVLMPDGVHGSDLYMDRDGSSIVAYGLSLSGSNQILENFEAHDVGSFATILETGQNNQIINPIIDGGKRQILVRGSTGTKIRNATLTNAGHSGVKAEPGLDDFVVDGLYCEGASNCFYADSFLSEKAHIASLTNVVAYNGVNGIQMGHAKVDLMDTVETKFNSGYGMYLAIDAEVTGIDVYNHDNGTGIGNYDSRLRDSATGYFTYPGKTDDQLTIEEKFLKYGSQYKQLHPAEVNDTGTLLTDSQNWGGSTGELVGTLDNVTWGADPWVPTSTANVSKFVTGGEVMDDDTGVGTGYWGVLESTAPTDGRIDAEFSKDETSGNGELTSYYKDETGSTEFTHTAEFDEASWDSATGEVADDASTAVAGVIAGLSESEENIDSYYYMIPDNPRIEVNINSQSGKNDVMKIHIEPELEEDRGFDLAQNKRAVRLAQRQDENVTAEKRNIKGSGITKTEIDFKRQGKPASKLRIDRSLEDHGRPDRVDEMLDQAIGSDFPEYELAKNTTGQHVAKIKYGTNVEVLIDDDMIEGATDTNFEYYKHVQQAIYDNIHLIGGGYAKIESDYLGGKKRPHKIRAKKGGETSENECTLDYTSSKSLYDQTAECFQNNYASSVPVTCTVVSNPGGGIDCSGGTLIRAYMPSCATSYHFTDLPQNCRAVQEVPYSEGALSLNDTERYFVVAQYGTDIYSTHPSAQGSSRGVRLVVRAEAKVGMKTTEYSGSTLWAYEPVEVLWDGETALYPFAFESDSDWTVDVCLEVPEGYVIADSQDCIQTFVTGEIKVVDFVVNEVGSIPKDAKVKFKLKGPDGKVQHVESKILTRMSKDLAKKKAAELLEAGCEVDEKGRLKKCDN